MANHTDDCPDCGEDRRLHGNFACCEAETRRRLEVKRNFIREQDERAALFDRLGIKHHQSPHYSGQWETKPDMESLIAKLKVWSGPPGCVPGEELPYAP